MHSIIPKEHIFRFTSARKYSQEFRERGEMWRGAWFLTSFRKSPANISAREQTMLSLSLSFFILSRYDLVFAHDEAGSLMG